MRAHNILYLTFLLFQILDNRIPYHVLWVDIAKPNYEVGQVG